MRLLQLLSLGMAHQCDVLADQVLQNCRSTAEDWRFGHVPEEVLVANQERVIWGLGCSSAKNGLSTVWPFFRTGDLGRLSANGLELQGRMDEKVKISGEQCTAAIMLALIPTCSVCALLAMLYSHAILQCLGEV